MGRRGQRKENNEENGCGQRWCEIVEFKIVERPERCPYSEAMNPREIHDQLCQSYWV
jgi:hypothetical protein